MSYFAHPSISNSDINLFLSQIGQKREMPANIQAIYEFGTLSHATILEPHLANQQHAEYALACRMRGTFWKDEQCRNFILAQDFEREKEYYGTLTVAGMRIQSRCKCDGVRTKLGYIMEIKGLNVTSQKQFNDALESFDYDRATVHYQLTTGFEWTLIVGISKKKDILFKKLVKRHDDFYAIGEEKLRQALTQLHQFSPEDVQLIAA